jgi:hypothetical protein
MRNNIYIKEIFTRVESQNSFPFDGNMEEKSVMMGCNDVTETRFSDVGKLFKSLQKEYGRCISSLYKEVNNTDSIKIGWVFRKKEKYSDCDKFYIQDVWVELHEKEPETTIQHFYKRI